MEWSYRWGIIGCGRVSHDFVQALKFLPQAKLVGVSARNVESARRFAELHAIHRVYDSYEALCTDPDVDIVYVGTVQHLHLKHAMLALQNNKHVLVEKPLGCTAAEAETLINEARARNLFLHEGMWTRFFPLYEHIRNVIDEGQIGDVKAVHSDFGINAADHEEYPTSPFYQHALGGGGLLFVGVYPVAVAPFVFGARMPTTIAATGIVDEPTGVDLSGGAVLKYGNDGIAILSWDITAETCEETTIVGTRGRIRICTPAHCPTKAVIIRKKEGRGNVEEEVVEFPLPEDPEAVVQAGGYNYPNSAGFQFEAAAVMKAIHEGRKECVEYPHDEMLAVAKIMDAIRAQVGVLPVPSSPSSV